MGKQLNMNFTLQAQKYYLTPIESTWNFVLISPPLLLRKQRGFRNVHKPNSTDNQSNIEQKDFLGVNHVYHIYVKPNRKGSCSASVNHCNSVNFSKLALSGYMTLFVFLS